MILLNFNDPDPSRKARNLLKVIIHETEQLIDFLNEFDKKEETDDD